MPDEDPEKVRERLSRREGQEGLFREKLFIFPCTLEAVRAASWGVEVDLVPIRAEGFLYPETPGLHVGVAWGAGSIGEDVWHGAQGASWVIYLDEALLRSARDVASDAAPLDRIERWKHLSAHLNEWDWRRLGLS